MKRWLTPGLLLLLASLSVYGATLLGDEAFFFRDVLHYYWPTRTAAAEAWRALQVPQWFPGVLGGLPLLADPHAAVLYPPNLLYCVLSFPRAYALLLVLHHVLGALGLFALARRWGADAWGALAAALAYLLSGYVVSLSWAGPLMAGNAYVPWVLWVLLSGAPLRQRLGLVALLCGLQALSGDPQSVVFSGLGALALLAWQRPARGLAVVVGGFALAGALAAVQLLPAWQLLQQTTRAVPQASFATEWATHPLRLGELFLALPYGGYLEQPQFWAWFSIEGPANTPFALSVYLGMSTLVLGCLGLSRERGARFALTLASVGLLLALGPHVGLQWVLTHVPPFRLFRYPEKYLYLATLGWALLVGFGLTRLRAGPALPRKRLLALAGALGLLVLLWLGSHVLRDTALQLSAALLQRVRSRADPSRPLELAQDSVQTALAFALLMAAALVLVRRQPARPLPCALVLALIATDLWLPARRVTWTEDIGLYGHTPRVVEALGAQQPQQPGRFWRDAEGLEAISPGGLSLVALSNKRAWEVETLKSNLGTLWGLEESSGYSAVQLTQHELVLALLRGDPLRIAPLFNTCLFLTSPSRAAGFRDPRVRQVQEWPELQTVLLRLQDCLPRLRGVERTLPAASLREAVQRLRGADFVPARDAVLMSGPAQRFEPLRLESARYAPASITAEVQVPPGGGLLVLAQTYFPGWRALVDGQPVPLEQVNIGTMGARIPEGRHRVEFRFLQPGLVPGAVLSGLAALVIAALLLLRRRAPPLAPAPPP